MTEFVYGNEQEYEGRPSKSQRKRDMLALQELGEKLIGLSRDQLGRMGLPEELAEAISFFHAIKDKEARRRQQQFIGTVMRRIDPAPLQEAFAELDQVRFQQAEDFHQIEVWRDALVADDQEVFEEVALRFSLDRQQLRQLVRHAAAEKTSGRPSKNGRALFRLLRQSLEAEGCQDQSSEMP